MVEIDEMADVTSVVKKSLALSRSVSWQRMFRYTAGSAICFGVSELTFVVVFAPHLLGARGSSVVASIAGIIPGYFLNRTWTWNRRGRSDFWREVVPYWATAIFSTIVAALVIGVVNDAFINYSRDVRTVLNATAYMVTYGVIFVGKFILFEKVLFAGERENLRPATRRPATDSDGEVSLEPLETAQPYGRG